MMEEHQVHLDHSDVNVAATHITKYNKVYLEMNLSQKYQDRWKKILEDFDKEFKKVLKKENLLHERRMTKENKYMWKKLNRLMRYEAKQVQLDDWKFESSCNDNMEQLTARLKMVPKDFQNENQKALEMAGIEQRNLAQSRLEELQETHANQLCKLTKHWEQRKLENWTNTKTRILTAHEIQVRGINEREVKRAQAIIEKKRRELQPRLDLLTRDREKVTEQNQTLKEKLKAMKIKELSANLSLNKLKTSFERFIAETYRANDIEARIILSGLLMNNEHQLLEKSPPSGSVK